MNNKKQKINNIINRIVEQQLKVNTINICIDPDVITEKIGQGLLYIGFLPALLDQNSEIFKDGKNKIYSKELEEISAQIYFILTDYLSKNIYDDSQLNKTGNFTVN